MSARRPRKSHDGEHEGGGTERWTTSYMDMVTVLMCLFIVLYSMSTFDKDKFEKLRFALATGFGQTRSMSVDTATGVVVPKKDVGTKGIDAAQQTSTGPETTAEKAAAEADKLKGLEGSIQAALAAQGVQSNVSFTITSRGLTIGLVGSQTFFSGNSDVLQPATQQVLGAMGPILRTLPNQIAVEGHADSHSNPAPFASDWELAAARSTAVLEYLVDNQGVSQTQIYSSSYGAARPLEPNMAPSQYALNRRVDIVILSSASEAVRDDIPAEVAAGK
jgi:chemotaxis protein MotB